MSQHIERSAPPHGGADPRSEEVRRELDRIDRRWGQLPLVSAQKGMPAMRRTLDILTAAAGQRPVPDLGPGSAVHQLKVLVWEAARVRGADGIPDLHELLVELRRALP